MSNLIGSKPEQLPTNGDLGALAFQEPEALCIRPQAVATPHEAGDMVFQLTSNTSLLVRVRGTDGVVRSATLTLA